MTTSAVEKNVRSRLLIAALLLWVVFLAYETGVRTWDLYRVAPLVDLPGHFLAGMAISAIAYWALQRSWSKRRRTAMPFGAAAWITVAAGLLWEGVEKVQEIVSPDPAYLRDVFWWDGFTDVIATAIGGVVVFPVLRWLRDQFRAFHPMDV